ncbi:SRPBCC domain-containing protein [Geomonas silvestris]|uniref:SRPBCC domain-containing protein n=1 Tax=Geomonas silvestris TaxID=2740184 RepID=A0A6V8MIP7_9BACT|nr:SRPBCC family protein [Geomonas silvestris]GFO59549.1 SRPBCC domain-containing protein [Geomonas silvestris]
MSVERFEQVHLLPITLDKAWDFFGCPENLATITPPWLGFKVTSPPQSEMYAGMIITYTVTPLLGLPLSWVTEITHCEAPHYFVDEQRLGPYRLWHHQHLFREVPQGVEMRDIVHFALPLGPLGSLASGMVRRKIGAIFDYRREVVERLFGLEPGARD